jgi:hypothetical protein
MYLSIPTQAIPVTNSLSGISSVVDCVFGGDKVRCPDLSEGVRSLIFHCAADRFVERPVTPKVARSKPGSIATMEVIRIGKGPALKAGAAQAMQVRVRATSAIFISSSVVEQASSNRLIGNSNLSLCTIMGSRLIGRTMAFEAVYLGSNPSSPESCLSSSSLGLLFVEQAMRVRLPSSTPCTSCVMVTRADCKPANYQFESDLVLQRPARKMVNPSALEAGVSQFESEAGHIRESVKGKPLVSKTKTLGSSPSSRANLPPISTTNHCVTMVDSRLRPMNASVVSGTRCLSRFQNPGRKIANKSATFLHDCRRWPSPPSDWHPSWPSSTVEIWRSVVSSNQRPLSPSRRPWQTEDKW